LHVRRRRGLQAGVEVAQQVLAAREQQRRDAALAGLLAHDDLAVGGHVEVERRAVGYEGLLLGIAVLPEHAPGPLEGDDSALHHLLRQEARAVGLDEVGGEVGHALVALLDAAGQGLGGAGRRSHTGTDARLRTMPVSPRAATSSTERQVSTIISGVRPTGGARPSLREAARRDMECPPAMSAHWTIGEMNLADVVRSSPRASLNELECLGDDFPRAPVANEKRRSRNAQRCGSIVAGAGPIEYRC
jgi:hypothetical protein